MLNTEIWRGKEEWRCGFRVPRRVICRAFEARKWCVCEPGGVYTILVEQAHLQTGVLFGAPCGDFEKNS